VGKHKHQLQHQVFRDGTKSLWLLQKVQEHPLEQGLNAEAIAKHDENGNVKGQELKHYACADVWLRP
jgi:hypothetical protein